MHVVRQRSDASRVSLLSTPLCIHTRTFLALTGTAHEVTASQAEIHEIYMKGTRDSKMLCAILPISVKQRSHKDAVPQQSAMVPMVGGAAKHQCWESL